LLPPSARIAGHRGLEQVRGESIKRNLLDFQQFRSLRNLRKTVHLESLWLGCADAPKRFEAVTPIRFVPDYIL
jgi:hypothetical protein